MGTQYLFHALLVLCPHNAVEISIMSPLNIYASWIKVSKQPMFLPTITTFHPVRFYIAAVWVFLCLLMVGGPILALLERHTLSSVIYLGFSGVCHQIPERSFFIAGIPLAVCHRCSGIYLGLLAGSFLKNAFMDRSLKIRRVWVMAAVIPLLLDVLLPLIGSGTNVPTGRFLTGLLFGTMLSSLFIRGIEELLARSRFIQGSIATGGIQ